jgi:hypothetical protein
LTAIVLPAFIVTLPAAFKVPYPLLYPAVIVPPLFTVIFFAEPVPVIVPPSLTVTVPDVNPSGLTEYGLLYNCSVPAYTSTLDVLPLAVSVHVPFPFFAIDLALSVPW